MTEPSPLTWDELDQLADYTAGTLTPQHTQHIAHLIATDPRWTTAHHTLQNTQPTITTALTTAANHTPPIPPELTTRLDTLHHIPRRLITVPRSRRPLLVGVAAVLAIVVGLGGVASLNDLVSGGSDAAEVDAGAPQAPSDGAPAPAVGMPPVLFASGRDYTRDTLQAMATVLDSRNDNVDTAQLSSGPLAELATAARFAECAAAVRTRYPGEVRAADFARYEGSPAVILRVERGSVALIVAVGPDCGRDGDPHELETVEVG